jgi:hypothetical protein
MSPLVHGRIYAESHRSSLARREFRILLNPSGLNGAVPHLIEIDVLCQYLQSRPGPPCRIVFVASAEDPSAPPSSYAGLTFLGLRIVSISDAVSAEVAEALGANAEGPLRLLVGTALNNDIDIIAGATPPAGFEPQELTRPIGLTPWGLEARQAKL